MKSLIATIGLLATVSLGSRPAGACTFDTNVQDFTLRWASQSNNIIIGKVSVGGSTYVATCAATSDVTVGNSFAGTVEWPIVNNGGAWFIHNALQQDTRICLGDGNDKLRVVRAVESGPVVCGGITFAPLDYGNHLLIVGGGNGNDIVIGGDGDDIVDFYSGTTQASVEKASTGKRNDSIRSNRSGQTDAWGGTGNDSYFSYSGGSFNVNDIGGSDSFSGSLNSIDHFCGLGPSAFLTCGGSSGDAQNLRNPGPADCTFNFGLCAAQLLVPPPGPGDQ